MSKTKKGMSKKAARAAAEREQSKKKSQPKPKKDVAKKEPVTADLQTAALRQEANKIIPEVREQVAVIGNALAGSVELDRKVQDVLERELWRFCATPFKSRTAYVDDLRKVAGKSAATLWGLIGLQKALPESTAEQRQAIGPRKGAVLKRAVKQAKKKGQVLPPEIVDKAVTQSESELRKTVKEAGLGADPLIPHDDGQEKIFNPREGGSGVVEGNSESADQFSSAVEHAVEIAQKIYGVESKPEALQFVCKQFLLSQCDHPDYNDMNNIQALDHLKREKGKAKTA